MTITFTVPSIPIAQPRQRQRVVTLPGGHQFTNNYTPSRHPVNAFKAAVQLAASHAHTGAPLEGPIELAVTFVLERPSVMIWKKKPMLRAPHNHKPDVDNLLKSVMDALSGLLWRDDGQVSIVRAQKVIASGSEAPHVAVEVREVQPAASAVVHELVGMATAAEGELF